MTLQGLFDALLAAYGPRDWWPADGPFEMMVGAVLVQNTAWTQAHKAVKALEAAGLLSPAGLRAAPDEQLWEIIRPAGYFRVKSRRLRALAAFLEKFGDSPARLFELDAISLRQALLEVHGVGKETADSIICYEAHRPLFVVDAYTRRIFSRLGWVDIKASYDQIQDLVHQSLPGDAQLLGEFHALIVTHAKRHCRTRPLCEACPARAACAFPTP